MKFSWHLWVTQRNPLNNFADSGRELQAELNLLVAL